MANRHFGRISEVWKHLVLAEVLAVTRPTSFLDTHAGHALYPLVDDRERSYGVLAFDDLAVNDATFGSSAYGGVLSTLRHQGVLVGIPGGPLVAMAVLGNAAGYVFCDLDADSVGNIQELAIKRDVRTVTALNADGMGSVQNALASSDPARTVVFVDPFDHQNAGPAGLSALDVAVQTVRAGAMLVYWYGYNRIDQRSWIFDVLVQRVTAGDWWCGDVMVTAEGDTAAGDLGAASTPGTGFGLVCANVSSHAIERCTELGTSLAAAYRGRPLPSGEIGGLDFAVR